MLVLKISCSWFVILSALHAAATQRSLQTRVLLVGDGLELLCSIRNGSSVLWELTPPTDSMKSVIIASSRNKPANSRYKVDCNKPEACRLLISDIRQTDAGLYRCLETTTQSAFVMRPLVDLTVLAAVPNCITLKSYKTATLLDDLKIRCQVNYSGTEQPFIYCRELSANISPSPAAPVDTGNSSYHSLSFTYDIDVDRITKETRLECTTYANMKDFPHGHLQCTWRWSNDTGIERNYNNQTVVHPDSQGHEQVLVQPRPIYDELGSVAVAGNIADYDHIAQA